MWFIWNCFGAAMMFMGKINEFEVDFVAQNSRGTAYFQVALTVRDEKTLQQGS